MRSIKDFQPKKVSDSKKSKINTKDTLRLTAIQKARTGFVYVLLILWTCIILLPVIGVLISSLNVADSNYISFDFKTFKFGFNNFASLFKTGNGIYFGNWMLNSLFISVWTMIITVVIVSLTGYAYSRFRFKGRRVSIMIIMLIQMIPSISALIAIYIINELLNQTLHILPIFTLIIIYSGGSIAGNTFVLKGYLDSVSQEIDDSAKIDGCGNFKTYIRIIMPLARPMLMIIALWSFIGPFGDVILPKILLNNPITYTLPVGLHSLLIPNSQQQVYQPLYAAGALITAIPITALFIYSQRHMVSGLTTGGVK
ncbi:MAG: ABC transporter permease subunit [Mycoplasmataceae bacterium]|nr:ABC transporter permease subunit [Mycoplasmataceae bacterium]